MKRLVPVFVANDLELTLGHVLGQRPHQQRVHPAGVGAGHHLLKPPAVPRAGDVVGAQEGRIRHPARIRLGHLTPADRAELPGHREPDLVGVAGPAKVPRRQHIAPCELALGLGARQRQGRCLRAAVDPPDQARTLVEPRGARDRAPRGRGRQPGVQHPFCVAVHLDLEALEGVRAKRDGVLIGALGHLLHRLRVFPLAPGANDEVALGGPGIECLRPTASWPEGNRLGGCKQPFRPDLRRIGHVPLHDVGVGAVETARTATVEDVLLPVGQVLSRHEKAVPRHFYVGVDCLQVEVGGVDRKRDVHHDLDERGHARRLTLGSKVALHGAQDRGLVIALVVVPQQLRHC
mmetsp:Transcript_43921/g.125213  ORF Transcript_43921/g.125213 Transcript_43921/m.125213 type:complete len:348 (+) Transcript_43921:252-1295(+)